MNKIELLSPAGSIDSFMCAIDNGADAVYLGLTDFSARKNAENFTLDNLKYYLDYAHMFGVKVHVTLNTLIKDTEMSLFLDTAKQAYTLGADAFIVQDLFLGRTLRSLCPQVQLHLSTQAGVCNSLGAITAKEYGFDRVVLARETALADVKGISSVIPTEAFCQGALCTAFSGQCYFSSFVGNNSGNRGLCKQPCRMKYTLEGKQNYAISLADLCIGDKINDLIACGVSSFKIEGRMRRPEYVAAATKLYRSILDGKEVDLTEIKRTYNRNNYTCGLTFGQDERLVSNRIQNHIGQQIGNVSNVKKGTLEAKLSQALNVGDSFKVLRNLEEVGNAVAVKGANGSVQLTYQGSVNVGDTLNITTDTLLNAKLRSTKRQKTVKASARFVEGKKGSITLICDGVTVQAFTDNVLDPAQNAPLTQQELQANLQKTQLPFRIEWNDVTIGNVFVPKMQLNACRRKAYELLFNALAKYRIPKNGCLPVSTIESNLTTQSVGKCVIARDFAWVKSAQIDKAIFFPGNYDDDRLFDKFFTDTINVKKKYLLLPPYLSDSDIAILNGKIQRFDGIYSDNLAGIALARKWNKQLFNGCGMHVFNKTDADNIRPLGDFCFSKELTLKQMEQIGNGAVFSHGNIALMYLSYCPYGKHCDSCKRADITYLTDEDGRRFPLLRYRLNNRCRFVVYNCKVLLSALDNNIVMDFTLFSQQEALTMLGCLGDIDKLKERFAQFTNGHLYAPVN